LAPTDFIRRWRSATTSPLPFDADRVAHPAATPMTKLAVTITLAVSLSRPFIVPPLADRRASAASRPAGEGWP
jgi:hypothetical protein